MAVRALLRELLHSWGQVCPESAHQECEELQEVLQKAACSPFPLFFMLPEKEAVRHGLWIVLFQCLSCLTCTDAPLCAFR